MRSRSRLHASLAALAALASLALACGGCGGGGKGGGGVRTRVANVLVGGNRAGSVRGQIASVLAANQGTFGSFSQVGRQARSRARGLESVGRQLRSRAAGMRATTWTWTDDDGIEHTTTVHDDGTIEDRFTDQDGDNILIIRPDGTSTLVITAPDGGVTRLTRYADGSIRFEALRANGDRWDATVGPGDPNSDWWDRGVYMSLSKADGTSISLGHSAPTMSGSSITMTVTVRITVPSLTLLLDGNVVYDTNTEVLRVMSGVQGSVTVPDYVSTAPGATATAGLSGQLDMTYRGATGTLEYQNTLGAAFTDGSNVTLSERRTATSETGSATFTAANGSQVALSMTFNADSTSALRVTDQANAVEMTVTFSAQGAGSGTVTIGGQKAADVSIGSSGQGTLRYLDGSTEGVDVSGLRGLRSQPIFTILKDLFFTAAMLGSG